jgi:four helix bundle protein
VAANYRTACRSRSRAEFNARLGIVEEEADESVFWLELVEEAGLLPARRVQPLRQEAEEIVAIMSASRKTLARQTKSKIENRKSQMEPSDGH